MKGVIKNDNKINVKYYTSHECHNASVIKLMCHGFQMYCMPIKVRGKLRPIDRNNNNNEEDVEMEMDIEDEHIDIEDNPTPQSTANASPLPMDSDDGGLKTISLTKHVQRNGSWSSNKSNEDTEIDDISSTRSNSMNNKERKAMVITLNDDETPHMKQQMSMEWLTDDNENVKDYDYYLSSSSSSTMSSDTETETEEESSGDGLRSHHRNVSLKHKIKKRNFGSSISIDTTSGGKLLNAIINSDDEVAAIYLMDPDVKNRSSSAMAAGQGQKWTYDDETMIGAIKTPKFDKEKWKKEKEEKERKEKEKEANKRSSSAMGWKQWDYESLFGDGVQIGAIKTPKFDKEKWRKKKEREAKKKEEKEKRPSSATSWKKWSYDELFGDDVQIGAIKTPKFDKQKWREGKEKRKSSLMNETEHKILKTRARTRKRAASESQSHKTSGQWVYRASSCYEHQLGPVPDVCFKIEEDAVVGRDRVNVPAGEYKWNQVLFANANPGENPVGVYAGQTMHKLIDPL
eukprot:190313_1